ncbi:IucA/IucC family siderophore biosynthesis protein [Streptomyces sp. SCA3-4]|uniref:IucA/IucC family siderophore biosynthesis protein n=1 Tax=Streptomyces sichuanensis TaxID=2871810 RepID=UPI001CE2426D|nr:IucA/IucC family siderophore biosynthesis protein [Streptomyces sichuanensis]MCA6091406.1 IucA/IucC family siderophore biosynthesis protein [Streptomyces sichuanensis]
MEGDRVCDTAAGRKLAEQLDAFRPELVDVYRAGLPGARAAVLARLWRGLVHEPLPWVVSRVAGPDGVRLRLADGRYLHGPPSDPWATGTSVACVELDGRPFDHPARLLTALAVPGGERFAAELDHSAASMALSRTAPRPTGPPVAPWEWEQRSPDGHPYHPTCRSRPGFSAADQLAYAPEHRPVVGLRLAPVAGAAVRGPWPAELRDGRLTLIPVHPWQAEHTLTGRALLPGPEAHPLLSLRTLDLGRNVHVKTALSTQLTSAVRDISAYSVVNALITSDVVERVAERLGGRLHIARTLAAAGAGIPDLAAVIRESPYVYAGTREQVVPVAELPAYFAPLTPGERQKRVIEFAHLAVGVCLDLLDLGVALEAHGQNLLAVLDEEGRARRLVYRDLADIRISPVRLARHGLPPPPLTGRLLNDDPTSLRRKVFGCLVTGALGPLAGDAPALGAILRAATQGLAPTPDLRALMTERLPVKALTWMRLAPGGDQWALLPNPALLC